MVDKRRLNPPGYVYLDSEGAPLASGKIYTYDEGTTTNKTTYTDAAGGTPNANPVILDSEGRADIWLDTDVSYKIVVKDSADVTIKTEDNIAGVFDPNESGLSFNNLSFPDAKGILDSNSNEQLLFQETASAVNYIEITNAATGNSPDIKFTGSDTNVSGTISAKGSGTITFANSIAFSDSITIDGTSSNGGRLQLAEDTDNGTNYVEIRAASSIGSNFIYTLPDAVPGSSAYIVVGTDGTMTYDTNSITVAASQAQMEAASSNTVHATPGRLHNHPGVAKVYCTINGEGTVSILEDYGVASIVDNGVGDYTITFDTSFSTVNYTVVSGYAERTSASENAIRGFSLLSGGQSTGSVRLFAKRFVTSTAEDLDNSPAMVAIFGDHV